MNETADLVLNLQPKEFGLLASGNGLWFPCSIDKINWLDIAQLANAFPAPQRITNELNDTIQRSYFSLGRVL